MQLEASYKWRFHANGGFMQLEAIYNGNFVSALMFVMVAWLSSESPSENQ